MRCSWAKSTSGAWSSGTEAVKAKSMVDWVLAGRGFVTRRRWVTGSTSKTVSPAAQWTGVSGVGLESGTGMSRRRISRAFSKATQQVLATPGVRGRGARVAGTQTDAPQRVVGTCFGEAAVAGLN